MVHDYGNILDASKLKRLKEIDHHAHELAQHLKVSDKKKLIAIVSGDTIRGITGLARGARRAKQLAKAPRRGKWLEPISKSFEEDHEAGELDEAEEVLAVVLPADEDAALPLDPGEEAFDEPTSHVTA